MPQRYWRYPCCKELDGITMSELCPLCEKRGIFAYWGHSMHEAMSHYTRVYRLRPIGPHRPVADDLLHPLRSTCPQCQGRGLAGNEYECWECPHCEGGGGIWTAYDCEIFAAYSRIEREYPDAVPSAKGRRVGD